jgi:hypothetical protein
MGQLVKNTSITTKEGAAASVFLQGGTTAERPSSPIESLLRYNETTNTIEYYNGTAWNTIAINGLVAVTKDTFAGDASDLTFTMSKAVTAEEDIVVHVGGLYQTANVDYTTDGSTTLTFIVAPPNLQEIIVMHGYNTVA